MIPKLIFFEKLRLHYTYIYLLNFNCRSSITYLVKRILAIPLNHLTCSYLQVSKLAHHLYSLENQKSDSNMSFKPKIMPLSRFLILCSFSCHMIEKNHLLLFYNFNTYCSTLIPIKWLFKLDIYILWNEQLYMFVM